MQSKGPFSGFLLVSDMDGTLITGDFHIPERNIKAIERFKRNGGLFSIASGRYELSVKRYIDTVKPNAPLIACNGAIIYDFLKNKFAYQSLLPDDYSELVKIIMQRFPSVGIEVYADSCVYFICENAITRQHAIDEQLNYITADIENIKAKPYKMIFTCPEDCQKDISDFLNSYEHNGCYFVFSSKYYLEAIPSGVSKGTALIKLAEILGIDRKNTVAVGDYFNDIEMLNFAGMGAAVEGSHESVIKAADITVGKCENGAVADIIEILEAKYL